MTLDDLLRNRQRLFWILNTSGWAGYTLAAWLGALAHEKPESYFAVILAMAIAGFVATIPMRSI
ncbi:MAG: sensor histidine kinase, partial [Gammaproteobacteria bacterium]|nr:sensor histidine kinase [Gammaproteobacteria bacterium]